jgi:hypothetical protein
MHRARPSRRAIRAVKVPLGVANCRIYGKWRRATADPPCHAERGPEAARPGEATMLALFFGAITASTATVWRLILTNTPPGILRSWSGQGHDPE